MKIQRAMPNISKIKVRQVFYIEEYKDKIILITSDGKLFYNDL